MDLSFWTTAGHLSRTIWSPLTNLASDSCQSFAKYWKGVFICNYQPTKRSSRPDGL